MNPIGDFFPRALVVLSHAMLESTVRNVQKILHPKRSVEDLDFRWSASDLQVKIYGELAKCGVQLSWPSAEVRADIEIAVAALIDRRHRIAHHADLPVTEQRDFELLAHSGMWAAAAVMFAGATLVGAFPELRHPENADLLSRINAVRNEWRAFIAASFPVPALGVSDQFPG
ncbi:MAG: hypothetical protein M3N82_12090 [Pseudomonadota bacterium]|nr:hypothetical protein [Pseudomonadota bacterium]